MLRRLLVLSCTTLLFACAPPQQAEAPAPQAEEITPFATDLPAGAYRLDPSHASLIFRADHLGFAKYVGRFTVWDANLQLDPANPEAASVEVTIDPRSLDADNAPAGFLDELRGPNWFDTAQFPQMRFRSTSIELTAPNSARIHGDLTLHGQTKPVTLEATFNGGYAGHPMDPNARIGFSARGVLNRSDFGIILGIPAPGTTMGVGDQVEFIIEAEFTGPAWAEAPAAAQEQ